MPLHPGDRFELPVTREAWEAGDIPLTGAFRHLIAPAGEPTLVTLRGSFGRPTPAAWDGERGVLEVSTPEDLGRMTGAARRLELHVEQADPPCFRVGPQGQGSLALTWEIASREIGRRRAPSVGG